LGKWFSTRCNLASSVLACQSWKAVDLEQGVVPETGALAG